MIEKIEHDGRILALILRDTYDKEGLNFVTEQSHSFQVGIHNVSRGTRYRAHTSLPFEKIDSLKTNKIYYVKRGEVGIDIYGADNIRKEYVRLNAGDLIIFIDGGHGMDVLHDACIIEIKQGPYRGVEQDKKFIDEDKSI